MKELIEINAEQFEDSKKSKYFLLDFYSDECPNCDKLKPILEELNDDYDGVISFSKIFRQQNRELAVSLDVLSSPTILFFEDGEEKFRMSGEISKSVLKEEISKYVLLESDEKQEVEINEIYDLIIVGAGPAGLTAAIYAARYKMNTLIVSMDIGGLAATAHKVCNYPSYEEITGGDLMKRMHTQAINLGAKMNYFEVEKITKDNGIFNLKVKGEDKILLSRQVIYAAGSAHRKLNIPGEREFYGRGVSYCATCDAAFFLNQDVAVIGGGNSAITAAILLAEYANKVQIIYRKKNFSKVEPAWLELIENNPKITVLFEEELSEIKGDRSVEKIILNSGKEIDVNGVFIEIGSSPRTESLENLGVEFEDGYISVNRKQETNVDGLFAVGDVTAGTMRQIITSAGEGATAALHSYEYLKK